MLHYLGTARTAVTFCSPVFYCYTPPETSRTAGSERSTVFYCYTPQELHLLQSQSPAPCSIFTLPRNCTYCRLSAQHCVLLLHSPGTAHTAVSERITVFYCYTTQELQVLHAESAVPCSIFSLPRNCTYCRLRAQHRVLLLHFPGTARTAG